MPEALPHPETGPPMDPAGGRSSFSRWAVPITGLMAVLILVLISFVLIRNHIASLPLNLVPATDAMADHIEDLCMRSHLPPECIKRYESVARRDAGAQWNEHAFEVGVPASIPAESIIAALTHGMTLQQVSLERVEAPQGRWTELRFAMLNRMFAVVRVMGGAERYDLTAACDELARHVSAALARIPHFSDVRESARQDRQEGPVRWRAYAFRAVTGSVSDLGAVSGLLTSALPALQEDAPVIAPVAGQDAIEVTWKGLPVVRLDIERGVRLFDGAGVDLWMAPSRLYQSAPLLFRSLFGFEPEVPDTASRLPAREPETRPDSPKPATVSGTAPRAAIIVDDGGYGTLASDAILTMDTRLTLAILPGTPFARETAETARSRGFEVLVHLPLESENGEAAFPDQLTTRMNEEEMQECLDAALANVPGAAGLNNHTGSKFTADADAMERLLHGVKRRGLFFIDSRTTTDTVAETVARELGVPTASRAVFLDNESEPDAIRAQVAALVDAAESGAPAIGICHFRATTAALLPEILRFLETKGVTLVHASELVQ